MSGRWVGTILLLVVCEALGIFYAEWTNRLFVQMVPQVALSQFNLRAAHVTLIGSGAVLGLAVFVLALVAIALSRLFRSRGRPAAEAGR